MRRWKRALLLPFRGRDATFDYTAKVLALSPIAYWVMGESSGSVAQDSSGNGRVGAYTAVTLGAAGIGDGRTSASYDGSTSFCNVHSAGLAAAFNGAEGTAAAWCRVSAAGVWTDATARRVFRLASATVGNRLEVYRTATNNQIEMDYVAGGTAKGATMTLSPTTFFHVAITWSASGDAVKLYLNGVQQGATLTGLGIWAGTFSTTGNVIGANITTPLSVWSGTIAHVAVWASVLTGAQVASLAATP
jgi:hypothetical protein